MKLEPFTLKDLESYPKYPGTFGFILDVKNPMVPTQIAAIKSKIYESWDETAVIHADIADFIHGALVKYYIDHPESRAALEAYNKAKKAAEELLTYMEAMLHEDTKGEFGADLDSFRLYHSQCIDWKKDMQGDE